MASGMGAVELARGCEYKTMDLYIDRSPRLQFCRADAFHGLHRHRDGSLNFFHCYLFVSIYLASARLDNEWWGVGHGISIIHAAEVAYSEVSSLVYVHPCTECFLWGLAAISSVRGAPTYLSCVVVRMRARSLIAIG